MTSSKVAALEKEIIRLRSRIVAISGELQELQQLHRALDTIRTNLTAIDGLLSVLRPLPALPSGSRFVNDPA